MDAGLTATDAIVITLVAGICNAVPTVLNGAIGSNLHIPFPVAARASFGYWFSYFAIISRGILAMFWFGVQSANGGTCVTAVSIYFPTKVSTADRFRSSRRYGLALAI
jgi:nucleobase:cation symporter-1, NCS1 family